VVPARLENENPLSWASFNYSALRMNINDYVMMAKSFKKVYDSFQPFIGPNLHQDIEAVRRNIKAFKHNMLIVKTSIYKTSRIMKIKKHKRNKKNFVK